MKKEKSEFGKGLVICLVKFAEHFENDMIRKTLRYSNFLSKSEEEQKLIRSKNPPNNLDYGRINKEFDWWMTKMVPIRGTPEKTLSNEIELWLNRASDHLYDIEVPKGKKWDKIRKKVDKLQSKGLEIGHGFTKKIWKKEDVNELQNLTREIALDIDKLIGLKPDIGQW